MIVKTNETPYRDPEQVDEYIKGYMQRLRAAMDADNEAMAKHMADFARQTRTPIDQVLFDQQSSKSQTQIQRRMLQEVCEQNNLVMYSALAGENVFRKISS